MNKHLTLIILLLACNICHSQNLVPNGGFEQYTTCPSSQGMISLAAPWFNPALLTPDFYDSCSSAMGVPNNSVGFQYAHSGAGYAGLFCSETQSAVNVREYMRVQLTQPLQAGADYSVQFYVNLGDFSGNCLTAMGAWFTETDTSPMVSYLMTGTPQVVNPVSNPLCDTANWMLVSGTFTAAGNESYMAIGNFADDTNCGLQNSNAGSWVAAYYYVDDVSVTITTGIKEENEKAAIKIYPDPFNDILHVSKIDNELSEIILYDIASRKLLEQSFSNSTSLNTSQLSKGIYIYEVRTKNGVVRQGKVIKE